jgi:nuclear transport factor 2 (NTF2) superfamily protein
MSVSGIGAMLGLAAPQAVKPGEAGKKAQDPAEIAKAKAEASAARQKADLAAIREKGVYAWAQEQKYEKIKEKLREEMEARAASKPKGEVEGDPETWNKPDLAIEQEVARQMRDMLEAAMKSESDAAAAEGKAAQPMIIDISV